MDNQSTQSGKVVISIIEEIQQSTDLSKEEIALLCKISTRTLYRMCSGQAQNLSTFQKLFGLYCLFCCVPQHKILASTLLSARGNKKSKPGHTHK